MRCIKKHVALGRLLWGAKQTCVSVFANVCTSPSVHSAMTASFQWKFFYFMYLFVCPSRVLSDVLAYLDTESVHYINSKQELSSSVASSGQDLLLLFQQKHWPRSLLSKSDTGFQNWLRFLSIFSWPQKLSSIDPWVLLAKDLCRVGHRAAGSPWHRNSHCMASRCCVQAE